MPARVVGVSCLACLVIIYLVVKMAWPFRSQLLDLVARGQLASSGYTTSPGIHHWSQACLEVLEGDESATRAQDRVLLRRQHPPVMLRRPAMLLTLAMILLVLRLSKTAMLGVSF